MSSPDKQYENALGMPIEYLWEPKIPLTVKLRVLLAHFYPHAVDTGTLANIAQESRSKIRDALKALSVQGVIKRGNGSNKLVADTLPETNEQGLRCLRGYYAKIKRKELPVPLKTRLTAQAEAARKGLYYRLPKERVRWLLRRDAFADPAWWRRGIDKLIANGDGALPTLGQHLRKVAVDHGVDVEGLTDTEAIVTLAVETINLIDREREGRVRNPCGLLTTILKQLDAEDIADNDLFHDAWKPWLTSFNEEPLSDRRSVGDYLARLEQVKADRADRAASASLEKADAPPSPATPPSGTPWPAMVGGASHDASTSGAHPSGQGARPGSTPAEATGPGPRPDEITDLCFTLLDGDEAPEVNHERRDLAHGVGHLRAGGQEC